MENQKTQTHRSRNWNNIPFSPQKWPFFYGWIIAAVSTIGMLASIPGQTIGVSVFTDYLIMGLQVSRNQLSITYMFGTVAGGLLLPAAGKMLDRIGARAMLVISSFGVGVGLFAMSWSGRISQMVDGYSVIPAMIIISGCFFLLRFFGQGCLVVVPRVVIGKWFNYYRGLVAAITGTFVTFGFNSAPLFLNRMIQRYGWQNTSLLLAVVITGMVGILGWMFYRDNPHICNLSMDGFTHPRKKGDASRKNPPIARQFTRAKSIRTRAFWAFSSGFAISGFIFTAITFHITSIGQEFGLDRSQVYFIFLILPFFSVSASFIGGWLSSRIKHKWLLMAMMGAVILGSIGALTLHQLAGQGLFALGFGTANGLFGVLTIVVWPHFFGHKYLGSISSLSMSIGIFGSALGPFVFSAGYEIAGSYKQVLAACLLAPAIMLLIAPKADNPQEKILQT
ncbi:MFS transporter [Candidatus Aerophobetes bacterium]|nr:MFS transporter [Candidatus Aerophobetes bacterium]